MAISEIEKLERRYAENPQGLTFAPLAEVHRKNGDVPRALELLGPGLALHPDYIPASIVLGRCHLDLGDQHAAEAAFTHVLSLDGENVIALKALAEITERLLRLDESERWLNTLLSVDRSNDEAQEQLERVQASRRQAEMASSASPGADLVIEPALESAEAPTPEPVETEPVGLEVSSVSPSPPPPPPFGDLPAEPGMGWVTASDAPSSEEAVPLAFEDLEPESSGILSEPVEPLSGIIGMTDTGDASRVGPLESLGHGFHVETNEDIVLRSSGATEFQVPNASEEFLGSTPKPPPLILPEAEPEPEPVAQPVRTSQAEPPAESELPHVPELEIAPLPEAEPVVAGSAEATVGPLPDQPPDPMMTESMAELLLSQGHREEALRVYLDLHGRIGGDSRLEERIADLERPKPVSPPERQYAAGATGGRSARDFLRTMLASRPPQVPGAPAAKAESARTGSAADAGGAPTRPAHDALSLSSVFGEDATPTRPAVSASGSAAAGSVSYDEFFKAPPSGGSSRPARSPDPKSDDLDQFHTWLQNLKR
jgi:tetratricopeptide (TPR) repeat protein